jgi:hypothetical protein
MVHSVVERAAGPALLERDRELATIRAAINAAADGHGGVVWVEGPAGIGKTSLLRAAGEHAREAGLRVLRARPAALEREFAFGVIRGLFEPAVTAQPAVLASGPASLAAPVVTLAEPSGPAVTGERLHGLYWLTVALSDESPLVLIVDDVHWADGPSLQALAYLARRVEELPVAILLATRSDLAADLPNAIRDDEATVVVRPSPLTRTAGDHLVRTVLGDATPAFLDACHHAAGETHCWSRRCWPPCRRTRCVPTSRALPPYCATPRPSSPRSCWPGCGTCRRSGSDGPRRSRTGPERPLRRAAELAELAPDIALEAADALVAAQLLAPGRPLGFTHPLIAEAVTAHMSGPNATAATCARPAASPPTTPTRRVWRPTCSSSSRWPTPGWSGGCARRPVWRWPRARPAHRWPTCGGPSASPPSQPRCPSCSPSSGRHSSARARAPGSRRYARPSTMPRTLPQRPGSHSPCPAPPAAAAATGLPEDTVVAAAVALGDTEPDLLADLHTELAIADRIRTAPGYPTKARVGELADRAAARGDEATSLLLRVAALAALRDPAVGPAAGPLAVRAAACLSRAEPADAAALYWIGLVLAATDRLDGVLPAINATRSIAQHSGRLLDLAIATTLRAQVNYRLGRLPDAEEDAAMPDWLAGLYQGGQRRHVVAWHVLCLVERGLLDDAENDSRPAASRSRSAHC